MKAAGLSVAILTLIVAILQLVHDASGVGIAPVSVARDAYLDIFGSLAVDPSEVTPDDMVAANETLDEAMDEMIEQSFDTSAPTTPSNLHVASQDGCSVTLEWNPSTDNEGVTSYRIYDDGSFTGMVDGATTKFEMMLFPGSSSTFTAIASDGPNESEHSNEATASC